MVSVDENTLSSMIFAKLAFFISWSMKPEMLLSIFHCNLEVGKLFSCVLDLESFLSLPSSSLGEDFFYFISFI